MTSIDIQYFDQTRYSDKNMFLSKILLLYFKMFSFKSHALMMNFNNNLRYPYISVQKIIISIHTGKNNLVKKYLLIVPSKYRYIVYKSCCVWCGPTAFFAANWFRKAYFPSLLDKIQTRMMYITQICI